MNNPLRTIKSLTVQRKLDWLNHCLYCDTDDIDIHVELVAGNDCVWIYEIFHDIVYDTLRCKKTDVLYYHLDRLTNEARYHTQDRWYDRARYSIEQYDRRYW